MEADTHVTAVKHRVYETQAEAALRKHTETVFSGGRECPGSSLRIPSLHTCKQTAGREHKQQLVSEFNRQS